MQIATVHCPSCGAPLAVQYDTAALSCAYCGASLAVRRNAAGQPHLLLQGIGADTELLAASTVQGRLRERLQQLAAQHQTLAEREQEASEALASKREAARTSAGHGWRILAGSLGLLLLFAATDAPGLCLGIALFGALIGAAVVATSRIPTQSNQRYEEALRAQASQRADLEREMQAVHEQLREVEARIDRLSDAFMHRSANR